MNSENIKNIEEKLNAQGEASFLTSGASMAPLFKTHRDIAVVKKAEGKLKRHDVVLYSYPESTKAILHRIIKVRDDDTYVIRGDNTYKNEYVKRDMIIGVLTTIYRKGRYINCYDSRGYNMYVLFMRLGYPIRFALFKARRMLGRVKRKFMGEK